MTLLLIRLANRIISTQHAEAAASASSMVQAASACAANKPMRCTAKHPQHLKGYAAASSCAVTDSSCDAAASQPTYPAATSAAVTAEVLMTASHEVELSSHVLTDAASMPSCHITTLQLASWPLARAAVAAAATTAVAKVSASAAAAVASNISVHVLL